MPGASVPDVRGDPTAVWQVAGEMMRGTPILQADRDHFARFAELGLTADGFTEPADPDTRDSLYQGTRKGWELLAAVAADQRQAERFGVHLLSQGGWRWSAVGRDLDNTGVRDYGTEYVLRAWVNYLYYGMLPTEEALYSAAYTDSSGERLDSAGTTRLTPPTRPIIPRGSGR